MSAPLIESLEKLRGTPRDGALLRYSLGLEYLKAGDRSLAIAEQEFAEVERIEHPADARHAFAFSIVTLERRAPHGG